MSELITFKGYVSGTGTYTLESPAIRGSVDRIRVPKGCKLKVWAKRIAGEAAVVKIQFAPDITVDSPSWQDLDVEQLASPGEIVLEKRRPVVVNGYTGKEGIQIVRASGSGDSWIDIEVEFVCEEK